MILKVDVSSALATEDHPMNRKLILLTAILALAAAPAIASEGGTRDTRVNNIGILAGGVIGAVVGGPPGAIAGAAFGGITADRELVRKRSERLEHRVTALSAERDSLRSDHRSQKARIAKLDDRVAELEFVAESRIEAEQLAHGLEIEVGFRTDSAALPEGTHDALDALAGLLQAAPQLEVHLDGYADPRGDEHHNLRLSAARAEAVRDRLVTAGVSPERIRMTAHGAPGLLAPDAEADPDGWALQRRVSIRLESTEARLAVRH
jgi:outer membrane protein OmpA-like peptidoglycan-associated protein